jgi:hypothetical protein
LVLVSTTDADDFKRIFKTQFNKDECQRIAEIAFSIKEGQPFSSLSSKNGNLLNTIKTSIDSNNRELAATTLAQLSDELEILETTIKKQQSKNQVSIMVSVIGAVLTLVFGIMAMNIFSL